MIEPYGTGFRAVVTEYGPDAELEVVATDPYPSRDEAACAMQRLLQARADVRAGS